MSGLKREEIISRAEEHFRGMSTAFVLPLHTRLMARLYAERIAHLSTESSEEYKRNLLAELDAFCGTIRTNDDTRVVLRFVIDTLKDV